ncbi:anthranilate synthase component II [Kangiella aquimarina]|uniref:Aminodeoxychorismate/anthranilate synthase component II n=1 Tax=Kangiella aquimarina TaxID=261965 RepID=A0ABZ0X2I4_9GAMM|nr:aminodeoxychorismate/anthranilate synthase component II [Kangiella aquimarina]WQG84730.1 aminodeoxychorismate/anthranilate synthase component II [Kangiella aquimarina]
MKVLLIDNYDSFIYNLDYELQQLGFEVIVVRNDADYDFISNKAHNSDCVVLSPGPGRPADSGCCPQLLNDFKGIKPILGVCLGHQAIVESFGGVVEKAQQVVHGKVSNLKLKDVSQLFKGTSTNICVARYHSLVATKVPAELSITATADNEVMAVQHIKYPIYGLQFHPESIMSFVGHKLLENFKAIVTDFSSTLKGAGHDAVA